jgi:Cu-Zn family superoxide dismutase
LVPLLAALLACSPREDLAEAALPDAGADAVAAAAEPAPEAADANRVGARAALQGPPGSGVSGSVEVTDAPGGAQFAIHVRGVAPGRHGLHVHAAGTCDPPDFESAGDHYDHTGSPHACPPASPRHAGDLGAIGVAESGEGHLELTTDLLTAAAGPSSVVGHAVILHAGDDDCTTQPAGDSGERLACGVFESVPD